MDSNFRAFWLAPVTRNILGYSLFCERREKWRVVSRNFPKKKLKKRFFYPSDLVNIKTTIPLIHSDQGLTLETSAFQSLYGGQFTLSTPLINQIFVYPPQGRWRAVDIYLNASRLGIYPPLFTSPLGDSCILSLKWNLHRFPFFGLKTRKLIVSERDG